MNEPWFYAVWAMGAYLLGSVPPAYLLVRLVKGADIRTMGTASRAVRARIASRNQADLSSIAAAIL